MTGAPVNGGDTVIQRINAAKLSAGSRKSQAIWDIHYSDNSLKKNKKKNTDARPMRSPG